MKRTKESYQFGTYWTFYLSSTLTLTVHNSHKGKDAARHWAAHLIYTPDASQPHDAVDWIAVGKTRKEAFHNLRREAAMYQKLQRLMPLRTALTDPWPMLLRSVPNVHAMSNEELAT